MRDEEGTGLLMRIVACNPLTGKSRSLSLPRPLKSYVQDECDMDLLVGVTMDRETKSYHLLVAGRDESREYATFLFKSSTSTWVNGPSLELALTEIDGVESVYENRLYTAGRSVVGPDGNLYWTALINKLINVRLMATTNQVIEFDVQHETWRITEYWQIANPEGICVLRLHEHEGNDATNNFENHASSSAEVFVDRNYAKYPLQVERHWENALELGLNPAVKWMNHHEIVAVEEFFAIQGHFDDHRRQFAISHGSVTYHVMGVFSSWDRKMHLRASPKMYLKAITQDTADELEERFELVHVGRSRVWAYGASLTALP